MQGEIALATLARRLHEPGLIPDAPPVWHDDAVHALKSLPVAFTVPPGSGCPAGP